MTATYYVNLFEEVLEGAEPVVLFDCVVCGEQLYEDRKCIYTDGACDDCCECEGHN
jgi:hypothetical protein